MTEKQAARPARIDWEHSQMGEQPEMPMLTRMGASHAITLLIDARARARQGIDTGAEQEALIEAIRATAPAADRGRE